MPSLLQIMSGLPPRARRMFEALLLEQPEAFAEVERHVLARLSAIAKQDADGLDAAFADDGGLIESYLEDAIKASIPDGV